MAPDQSEVLLQAVYNYFTGIGLCGMHHSRWAVTVRLPTSRDEWEMTIEGDELVVIKDAARRHRSKIRPSDRFRISLADPESFPKVLAFIKERSIVRRGGTNHAIYTPTAL